MFKDAKKLIKSIGPGMIITPHLSVLVLSQQ